MSQKVTNNSLTSRDIFQPDKFQILKVTVIKYLTPLLLLLAIILNVEAKQFVVVIDPGHGGKDYGAIGTVTNEKTVNLNVANKLVEIIKTKYGEDEVKVVTTRSKDIFIPLDERPRIANNAKGNLFISIHCNSLDKKNKNRANISGTEVYTCGLHKSESNLAVAKRENAVMYLEDDYSQKYQGFDPNSPESYIAFELNQSKHLDRSIEFASLAKDYLTTTAQRTDKGVKQAGFWVLWSTGMPAVLVELDFISNPKAEKFMASTAGVDKMAKALFQAFEDYYNGVNGRSGEASGQLDKAGNNSPSVISDTPGSEDAVASEFEPNSGSGSDADPNVQETEYRVQVLANDRSLSPKSKLFKGEAVSEYFDKGLYKYTVGHFKTQTQAEKEMRRLRKKFPEAFVIKMINGQRVY